MNIPDRLLRNRPNLSPSTLKTYTSIIRNTYLKLVDGDTIPRNIKTDDIIEFFDDNQQKILDLLKETPINKRKTILASLVALTGKDMYRKQMIEDADAYNEQMRKQRKTETQDKNWITQEDVLTVYRQLQKDTRHLFSKPKLSISELQRLQDYVILSVYVLIPPRRLMDYTAFKVRNIDENKDNFMRKNTFVFNVYKTKKKYGQQVVNIPIKLRNIVQRWTKKHNNDYLLFGEKGLPIPPSRLTQKLNKIFGGKNISVNMLRHIYISDEVLKDVPALERLEEVAKDMGHSTDTQVLYKKV